MKKILLTLIFMFLCVKAFAGVGVCYDETGEITLLERDGKYSYFSTTPSCEYYSVPPLTAVEFDNLMVLIKNTPKKYLKVEGNRIVEKSQLDKDSTDTQEANKYNNERRAVIDELDISIKDAFIAWLKVFNSKVPAQYRVTPKELKDQIKADAGL